MLMLVTALSRRSDQGTLGSEKEQSGQVREQSKHTMCTSAAKSIKYKVQSIKHKVIKYKQAHHVHVRSHRPNSPLVTRERADALLSGDVPPLVARASTLVMYFLREVQ